MRDAMEIVGNITMQTKNTDYFSANYLDLGTIASASRFTRHTLFNGLYAVYANPAQAFASADNFTPFVYHADNSTFSSNQSKVAIFDSTAVSAVINSVWRFRVPENVREFIELGATALSSGTFSNATTVASWFEEGARQGPAL